MFTAALRAGADLYITGDVGYHDALDAVNAGLTVVDAGHNPTERIYLDTLVNILDREVSPGIEVRRVAWTQDVFRVV